MILQINKMYAPDIGGVETVVKEYSEYLKKFDDVVVLCVNKKLSFKTTIEIKNGIKIYRCASFGTYLSMPISIVFFYYLFTLSKKADFIHFHEPFPLGSIGSLLISKTKKIFVTWHSDIIKQKTIKSFFEYFQRKLCTKATNIVATSDKLVDFSKILTEFKDKTITIPLSLNPLDYLLTKDENLEFNQLEDDYVLFLGRFSYYKGIFVLLEAIEKIDKNIPFVIVGNGELKDEIKNRVKNSNKNIILIDKFVTDEEKKSLLANSKFMVFPSIYPSEAFGILQLESMIYGKPVINTNLPTGVPWVSLNSVSGITVEPFDSIGLAKSIEKLYYDDILYTKLSTGALKRFNENFTIDKTNKQLYNLYYGRETKCTAPSKIAHSCC